jgi:hypothetical protein
MPKYLELEGEIIIDLSSILGQVKNPEEPKKEEENKEKEEK